MVVHVQGLRQQLEDMGDFVGRGGVGHGCNAPLLVSPLLDVVVSAIVSAIVISERQAPTAVAPDISPTAVLPSLPLLQGNTCPACVPQEAEPEGAGGSTGSLILS
eukprot:8446885-Pyramimonas_sp.AAC.1